MIISKKSFVMVMIGLIVVNYLGCGSSSKSNNESSFNSYNGSVNSSKGDVNSYMPNTIKMKKIYYVSEKNIITKNQTTKFTDTDKILTSYQDGFFKEERLSLGVDGKWAKGETFYYPSIVSRVEKTDSGYLYYSYNTDYRTKKISLIVKSVVNFSKNGTEIHVDTFQSISVDKDGEAKGWKKISKDYYVKELSSNLTKKYEHKLYDVNGNIIKHTVIDNKISDGKIDETKFTRDGKLTMTVTSKYQDDLLTEIYHVVHHWFPCRDGLYESNEPCKTDERLTKFNLSSSSLGVPANPEKYSWKLKYDETGNIINRHLSAGDYEVDYNYKFNSRNQLTFMNKVVNGEEHWYHKYSYFNDEKNNGNVDVYYVLDLIQNMFGKLNYEENVRTYYDYDDGIKHTKKEKIFYTYDTNGLLKEKVYWRYEDNELKEKTVESFQWKSVDIYYSGKNKLPSFSKRIKGLMEHGEPPLTTMYALRDIIF